GVVSFSSSSSPSTGVSFVSATPNGSNMVTRSTTTLVSSKTEVAAPVQPRRGIEVDSKRQSSRTGTNLLPIGTGERRPSAPSIGEQPKYVEQRRPSLPMTKRVNPETGKRLLFV